VATLVAAVPPCRPAKGFEKERKRGQIVLFPVRLDQTVMKTNGMLDAPDFRTVSDLSRRGDRPGQRRRCRHGQRRGHHRAASRLRNGFVYTMERANGAMVGAKPYVGQRQLDQGHMRLFGARRSDLG
jgi:hypothetical protein